MPIPGAQVMLRDAHSGSLREIAADTEGMFFFSNLEPGEYTLQATKEGFKKFGVEHVWVRSRQISSMQLKLMSTTTESIPMMEGEPHESVQADSSTGTAINGDFAWKLLLNGRLLSPLTQLAPGTVSAGGFHSNGLPWLFNYYTIDGTGANVGLNPEGIKPGQPTSIGATPNYTAAGTTASLIALDAISELNVQTSTLTHEFARTPGAQIAAISRSGSTQWHGSAFEYFRNDRLNANDWFANAAGLNRPQASQDNFGGTLGGELIRNRTFFFASYEGLRLRSPETAVSTVPTVATRQNAAVALRPYLNAFPIPNGPSAGTDAALFTATYSNPGESDLGSLRLDHTISDRFKLFARYAYAPSSGTNRQNGFYTPNSVISTKMTSQTFTAGLTWIVKPLMQNDLRVNWTGLKASSFSYLDDFGGAVHLNISGAFSLATYGLSGYSFGAQVNDRIRQFTVTDSVSRIVGNHEYRLGFEFRRMTPTYSHPDYSQSVTFDGLSGRTNSLLSGLALNAVVAASSGPTNVEIANYALYAQDTWKANERTTLTYGLRLDVNPPPSATNGNLLTWNDDGTISNSRSLFLTRLNNISPKLGLAYQMDTAPGREMMFRAGVGISYDMSYGTTTGAFTNVPFIVSNLFTSPAFPLSAANTTAPVLPATPPYSQLDMTDRALEAPRVFNWNLSIERYFGYQQSLTIGYVGVKATRLLTRDVAGTFSENEYDIARITTNGARSSYQSIQAQFRRHFAKNFQGQISYTYSHAADTTSPGFWGDGFGVIYDERRASSAFDVRHGLHASGNWKLPSPGFGYLKTIFGDWSLQGMVTFRTALPLNIQTITGTTSETSKTDSTNNPMGFWALVYPNWNGQPVYVDDPNAPGGRRLNSAAFSQPSGYGQGTLGPNAIRGFNLFQADVSLRRQIHITDRVAAQFIVEAFNFLNHPNFANPLPNATANLSSNGFGGATSMANQNPDSPINSMYQHGGPRSIQLALRLQF